MNNKKREALNLVLRYFILLLIAIPGIKIFYFLFTNLTIYPVFYLVQIYSKATLNGNLITLSNNISFDIIHSVLWYGISTIFVVTLWFVLIFYFKIESIPVYSDLKFLYQSSSLYK